VRLIRPDQQFKLAPQPLDVDLIDAMVVEAAVLS
jgi:hypothetical protein